MKEKLLREFITSTIASTEKKKRDVGVIGKIKSFFTGTQGAEEAVNDWLDSVEERYSITLPKEIENDAMKLIKGKYQAIVQRYGSGGAQKISSIVSRILNKVYGSTLRELERLADEETGLSLDDDDDDDVALFRKLITRSRKTVTAAAKQPIAPTKKKGQGKG
jgi:hypothetical protein